MLLLIDFQSQRYSRSATASLFLTNRLSDQKRILAVLPLNIPQKNQPNDHVVECVQLGVHGLGGPIGFIQHHAVCARLPLVGF